MTSVLELQAAKTIIGASGQVGSMTIMPLDVDKVVTTANMKNGAYTIAAQPAAPCRITATVTAAGAADTMGNLLIVGTDRDGNALSETIIPVAGSTVSTVNVFKTVTSATGAGWTIGEGNDTITIGIGAVSTQPLYYEADTDRIVTSTNMKVGAYTVAAQPQYPTTITVRATAGATADTMGTVTISGFDENNSPISEVIIPVAGSTIVGTKTFKTILSVVGAGWVIDGAEGTNDTIVVGVSAKTLLSTYYISHIQITAAAVAAAQTAQTGFYIADLTQLTSIPAGSYATRLTSINLTSGQGIAYLSSI
jgi:hypothetical protein